MAEPAARAVVSDDGSTIWLTVYSESGEAVPVALAPVRAVAIAGDLIRAAVPKLDTTVNSAVAMPPKHRRGGDRLPDKRRTRGEALAELTAMQPGDTEGARIHAAKSKLERYAANGWPREQDKPGEEPGNRERDLLRKIMRTGLPIVRERQHRTILGVFTKKVAVQSNAEQLARLDCTTPLPS